MAIERRIFFKLSLAGLLPKPAITAAPAEAIAAPAAVVAEAVAQATPSAPVLSVAAQQAIGALQSLLEVNESIEELTKSFKRENFKRKNYVGKRVSWQEEQIEVFQKALPEYYRRSEGLFEKRNRAMVAFVESYAGHKEVHQDMEDIRNLIGLADSQGRDASQYWRMPPVAK